MSTTFNDANAWLKGNGNLSLGVSGKDDAAYNATYTYAKDDVWLPVSPMVIVSDTQPALTYVATGQPSRTLAASTTHTVSVPLDFAPFRSFLGNVNTSAPHGILIKSVTLFYRVNTNPLTSFASMAVYQIPNAAGAALPTPAAITSTLAGNTLTNAANTYAAVSTITTPTWINTLNTLVFAMPVIVTPGSCTCDVLGASWNVAVALY